MTGAVREIQPGLWRVRLPFHLELDHVNIHVARINGGYMVIDAGYGSEESWAVLEAAFNELGVAFSGIHTVLFTHTHPDHIGLASRILERSGARLLMHEDEDRQLRKMSESGRPERLFRRLVSWGAPEEFIADISQSFFAVRQTFQELRPHAHVNEGDRIGPWRLIVTPGHSPGHTCLYDDAARLLISGDHVLSKITPHVGWMAETDALGNYLASLERIASVDAARISPSHGDVFEGLAERAREIAAHHEWRCCVILKALGGDSLTPHELVARVWPKRLSPFQHRFALYELMSHLAYMEPRGRAECVSEGPLRWRATDSGNLSSVGA